MGRNWVYDLSNTKTVGEMTREIKFRAWDKGTNQMIVTGFHVFGETILFHGIEIFLHENNMGKSTLDRMGDVVVMQYTGLKDSIGKEIYEGDVLKDYTNEIVGAVEWQYSEFIVRPDELHWKHIGKSEDWEVIGNIYQHPELIKTNP